MGNERDEEEEEKVSFKRMDQLNRAACIDLQLFRIASERRKKKGRKVNNLCDQRYCEWM